MDHHSIESSSSSTRTSTDTSMSCDEDGRRDRTPGSIVPHPSDANLPHPSSPNNSVPTTLSSNTTTKQYTNTNPNGPDLLSLDPQQSSPHDISHSPPPSTTATTTRLSYKQQQTIVPIHYYEPLMKRTEGILLKRHFCVSILETNERGKRCVVVESSDDDDETKEDGAGGTKVHTSGGCDDDDNCDIDYDSTTSPKLPSMPIDNNTNNGDNKQIDTTAIINTTLFYMPHW